MALRGLSPADLNPLDAASAPITPDPAVASRGWAVRGNTPREDMIRRYVSAGFTLEEATRLVDRETARSGDRPRGLFEQDNTPWGNAALADRVSGLRQTEARQEQFERDYNDATGMPVRPQVAVSAPQVDDDMVPLTPDQLRALGQNPYTEPGVNMPDGTLAARPRAIENERAARVYNERIPVTGDMQGQVPQDAAFAPSMRDRAMAARGFYPVYRPDGSVGYSVGTGTEMRNSQDIADGRGIPGGLGRSGPRADLEPGFDLVPVRGPNGTVYVYRQNEESRAKQAAYMQERQVARMADATGLDESALAAMSPEERRMAVRSSKRSDAQDRMNAWKSQMMLAGRNPAKNMVNAFNAMGDSDLTDQQRSSLRYMLPGGQLAAAVDAKQLDEAAALAQRAVTGALAGGGHTSLAQAQMEQASRDRAVKRADELIARYPRGYDGMYDAADVEAVRTAVNKQHPGLGDAAVAHLPVRPARPPAPGVGGGPTGGAAPLPTAPPPRGDL